MTDRIWISWNKQRRNIGLAAATGAYLYMSDLNLPRCFRIPSEFLSSWKIIRKERPSICFTMNPSIFASWWLSLLARFYRFRLVTDLHTLNINITGLKKVLFRMFFNSGIKGSDMVIVTNEIYRQSILPMNPNVICVPDDLPILQAPSVEINDNSGNGNKKIEVLLISSFDPDEPLSEIMAIDSELDEFKILVTGNWRKKFKSVPNFRNIQFLGFISNKDYDQLLYTVDGVMVLTKEEGCLCCGAYEAVSAGQPLILSRTKALQDFFGEAPIYVQNTSGSILTALKTLKRERSQRMKMIIQERSILSSKFKNSIRDLEKAIKNLPVNGCNESIK